MGYVSKVFCSLVEKYRLRLWKYLQTYQENLEALLKRAEEQSVETMVTRLVESTYGECTDGEFVGQKQSLIRKLVEEADENSAEGRCTLLTSLINAKVEIGYFMSEEVVNLLYQLADKNTALGLKLIKSLMESYNSDKSKIVQGDDPSSIRNHT